MDKETVLKLRKLCSGLKVLYVEDDESISKQLHRVLKKIFNNVDMENNGKDGLEKYIEHKHDIVITDISMPLMNGIEMSHKIKRINEDQVIIVTSAHGETKYMSRLIDIGVDKFVHKPIDLNAFLNILAKTAVKILKDKKENLLLNKKMKDNVFGGMSNPIAVIKNNRFIYVNELFEKNFLKASDGDISEFKLGYLFKDKDMLVLKNQDILERIIGLKRVYEILHVDSKIYKTYKIDIVQTEEEENQCLLNFINIDFVLNDLEKSNMYNGSGFNTRRNFIEKVESIYKDKESYDVFCFGLRNLNEYIKEYGAKQMNLINSRICSNVREEFSDNIKNQEISIYLFDTNRYILIANRKVCKDVSDKLKNFGENYQCAKGRSLAFHLDYIGENLKKELSQKEIIENTEAMLYMLKD